MPIDTTIDKSAHSDPGRSTATEAIDRKTVKRLSVIVPAYNAAEYLPECLAAIKQQADADVEIIVADDKSTDNTYEVAHHAEVTVLQPSCNLGPGRIRNFAAEYALGDLLLFVDSDVIIAPNTLLQVTQYFEQYPETDALFGSYDAQPAAQNLISLYRNLLHHYVHQTSTEEASHFWTGLGAVRTSAFKEVGGFDTGRYSRKCEDIEFGYRLRDRGFQIRLDKSILGTHLKRWTLGSMLRTDLRLRGIPWTHLLLERKTMPADFSLDTRNRNSVIMACLTALLTLASIVQPQALVLVVLCMALFIAINSGFFRFLAKSRGWLFCVRCLPLHLLYYLNAGLAFGLGFLGYALAALAPPGQTRSSSN